MLDYFKELVSAANSRVRSPVLGSIAVVFIAFNWKELFYVIFAKTSVQVRLSYFDVNTDSWSLIYWPLIIGGALSFLYPWITLASSQLAKFPVRALKTMQGEEEIMRQIRSLEDEANIEKAKADLEEARADLEKESEGRAIAAAQRLKEAEEISPSVAEVIKKTRTDDNLSHNNLERVHELDAIGRVFLLGLAKNEAGEGAIRKIEPQEPSSEAIMEFANRPEGMVKLGNHRRTKLQFEDTIAQMEKLNFIEKTEGSTVDYNVFRITEFGYLASDELDEDFNALRDSIQIAVELGAKNMTDLSD